MPLSQLLGRISGGGSGSTRHCSDTTFVKTAGSSDAGDHAAASEEDDGGGEIKRVAVDRGSERWGTLPFLDDDQKAALQEFSRRSELLHMDDHEALRYLRARRFDVQKALKLAGESREWRRGCKAGELDIPLEQAKALLRIAIMPVMFLDSQGRPVMVADPSQHRRKMGQATTQRLFLYLFETCFIPAMPPGVSDMIIVFDLRHFSLLNADLGDSITLVNTMQVGYPERLCRCVFFMAPRVFFAIFWAVRRFMDRRLANKVMFAFSVEELHRAVDPSVLPPSLGGAGPPYSQEESFRRFVEQGRPVRQHAELLAAGCGGGGDGAPVVALSTAGGVPAVANEATAAVQS